MGYIWDFLRGVVWGGVCSSCLLIGMLVEKTQNPNWFFLLYIIGIGGMFVIMDLEKLAK